MIYEYQYSGDIDLSVLDTAIKESSFSTKYEDVCLGGPGIIQVKFSEELSVGEKTELDSFAEEAIEALNKYKEKKCLEIDAKTAEICLSGFHYVNGDIDVWFSTSLEAQSNWVGLKALYDTCKQAGNPMTFPMPMPTKPLDGGNWLCPSEEIYLDICIKMGQARAANIIFGQQLKEQVRLASTKAEVDAVVDPR